MSGYIYETHLHTDKGSACGRSSGDSYIQYYMDMGYSGIIVTDHFFRGNCAVPRDLDWKERVNRFCAGYEEAWNEGQRRNFSVFFGWEERHDWDEYLIYGLDKQFMLAHPEMEHWTRKEQYEAVHAAGGCVVQAHPFRAAEYITDIRLTAGCVDAIEGINTGNHPEWNTLALRYGQLLNVPMTAGSDIHASYSKTAEQLAGIEVDTPLKDIHDLVRIILNREPMRMHTSELPQAWQPGMKPERPAKLYGADDRFITDRVTDFLDGKPFAGIR